MAITYGAIDNHLYAGLLVAQTPSTVDSGDASVSLAVNCYVKTDSIGWDWSDPQAADLSNGASAHFTYTNNLTDPNEAMSIGVKTISVALIYGSTQTKTFKLQVDGASTYNGANPVVTLTVTIPARPVGTPGLPTALTSSAITYNSATLSWTQPSAWGGDDSDDYDLQIATDSGFTTGLQTLSIINAATRNVTGLVAGQLYYSRVRAKNSAGAGSYTSAVTFTTTGYAVPTVPTALTSGSVTASSFLASWASPTDWNGDETGNYDLQVATNSAFTTGLQTLSITAAVARSVTGLLPNVTYYYRVRAKNVAGAGPYTAYQTVLTLTEVPTAPGTITLSEIGPTSARATWSSPSYWGGDNDGDYDLQWSTSSSFTTPTTISVLDAVTYNVTGLPAGVTVYFRVRAKNTLGAGPWSGVGPGATLSGGKVYDDDTTMKVATFKVWDGTTWKTATTSVWDDSLVFKPGI